MAELAAHLTDHVLPHLPCQAAGPRGSQAPPSLPASQPRHRRCRPPGPRFARCPPTRHPHHPPPRQPRCALGRPARGRQLPAPLRLLPQRPSPLPPGRPRRRLLLDELDALDMLSWQGSGGFSIDAGPPRDACIAWGRALPCASRGTTAPASRASCAGTDAKRWSCPPTLRARRPSRFRRRRLPRLSRRAAPLSVSQTHPGWAHRTRPIASPAPRAPRRLRRRRRACTATATTANTGVLAPHAGLRSAVVAIGRAPAETPSSADGVRPDPVPGDLDELPRSVSPARIRWAVLLARIYDVLPLLCPGTARSVVAVGP